MSCPYAGPRLIIFTKEIPLIKSKLTRPLRTTHLEGDLYGLTAHMDDMDRLGVSIRCIRSFWLYLPHFPALGVLFLLPDGNLLLQPLYPEVHGLRVQGDSLNMAILFWYLVKSDLSSVRYFTRVHWTSHFFQGTRKT